MDRLFGVISANYGDGNVLAGDVTVLCCQGLETVLYVTLSAESTYGWLRTVHALLMIKQPTGGCDHNKTFGQ